MANEIVLAVSVAAPPVSLSVSLPVTTNLDTSLPVSVRVETDVSL